MVPYSPSIWYHSLLHYGTIFFYVFTLVENQGFQDPFSKQSFSNFNYGPAALWITGLSALWITGLSALWITWLTPLGITHAGACCGLRERGSLWITGFALWITMLRCGFPSPSGSGAYVRTLVRAVDFPALRARAHMSGPVGPVDYASL